MKSEEIQNPWNGCYQFKMGEFDIVAEDDGCGIFNIYDVSSLEDRYFCGKIRIPQGLSRKKEIEAIKEKYLLMS